MEVLYKGCKWSLDVTLEGNVALTAAWLFNPATKEKVSLTIDTVVTGSQYTIKLLSSQTTDIGVGVYNLELYRYTDMYANKQNFVKVVETALSN